jgi:hypothetical protein
MVHSVITTGAGRACDEATVPLGQPSAEPLLAPRQLYIRPVIEPLGHWQVHTMDLTSACVSGCG